MIMAKIFFDYKKNQSSVFLEHNDFFTYPGFDFCLHDFISQFDIFFEIQKKIYDLENKKTRSIESNDLWLLKDYSKNLMNFLFATVKNSNLREDFSDCLHPFLDFLSFPNINKSITEEKAKKLENNFVRASNQQRKKIIDSLKTKFLVSENIFVSRFDIIFRGSRQLHQSQSYSIRDFQKEIILLIDFLKGYYGDYFQSTFHVIYPSKIISGSISSSSSFVGQIVLVANKKIHANKKNLIEFSKNTHESGLLQLQPAKPLAKGLIPSVDGFLDFTPKSVEGINWLAEFLTLERRYVRPPAGSADGSGRTHCFDSYEFK